MDKVKVLSRRARIATVCLAGRLHPSVERNREQAMGLLELALRQRPDLVCLPETFATASVEGTPQQLAEGVPGPTTDAVAERAKAHGCYVICTLLTRRDGRYWNSAVLIDRSGSVVGIYDKMHPVTSTADYTLMEGGVAPGTAAPVFDLDFGKVGIQICFDAGFPETWQELAAQGARAVFWPSAYNGGFPLQAYAYLHHYYVISAVWSERSRIIDPCGRILAETDRLAQVIWRDINLDYVVCHYDFNWSIPDRLLKAYPGRVEVRSYMDDAHLIVEPLDDALTITQLQSEFGFESTAAYHERHRRAYSSLREDSPAPPQDAAHGRRPMHDKD